MSKNIFLFIASIILAISVAVPAEAQTSHRGEKTFGVKGGYVTRNRSGMAGIFFQYRFSEHFRLAPNIDYSFKHDDVDAFAFNVDTHYPIAVGSSKVEVYPIAGVNYVMWSYPDSPQMRMERKADVTTRHNRVGFNAGLGLSYQATPTLRISVEGKFNGVKALSTGVFGASIGYTF